MNIFSYFKKKQSNIDYDTDLIKLLTQKNSNFQEILNSNIFSKILRTQSEEIFYEKSDVLVLAPHPDDEVIGCGGSMELLKKNDSSIQVVYLSNGIPDKGEEIKKQILKRKQEAIELNQYKKFNTPVFFDLETRKIEFNYTEKINELKKIISQIKPNLIFVPFVVDRVNDHQFANKLLYNSLKDITYENCFIYSYQVSNFIKLNSYVDITNVFSDKIEMMRFYKSVLEKTNYINLFKGLNLYNSFFVKNRNLKEEKYYEVFLKQKIKDYLKICELIF